MKTYKSITDLVGGTPLLELKNYEKSKELSAKLDAFRAAQTQKVLDATI